MVITRCTSGSTTVSSWRRCSASTSRSPASRMSRALRCSSQGWSTTAANPSVMPSRAGRCRRAPRTSPAPRRGRPRCRAPRRGEEHGPVQGVLGGVVVVQGPGEPRPPVGQRLPGVTVAERGRPHGRRERREVAPERVVHHVHPGVVVGALGDERLAGQVDLGVACGVAAWSWCGWSWGAPQVRRWWSGRVGRPLGIHRGGPLLGAAWAAGASAGQAARATVDADSTPPDPEEQLPMSYDPTTATTTTQPPPPPPPPARPRPPPRRMPCRPTPRSSSWAAPA